VKAAAWTDARGVVMHVDQAPTGPVHPEPLPPHRLVRSCVDVKGFPDCMGAAAMDATRCTCTLVTDEQTDLCLRDAWQSWLDRSGAPCVDCAFRKGSPEDVDGLLVRLRTQPEPFRCHQGMPVDARRGTPVFDSYHPGSARERYPICAGWRRCQASLFRRTLGAP
jgi:hypothetical protein